jgi:PAS domain-containing protein
MTAAPVATSPQDEFAPLSESRTKGAHRAIVTTHEEVVDLNTSLRESEERYRTLFDLSPVAVYSIDVGPRQRIHLCPPRRMVLAANAREIHRRFRHLKV